MDFQAGGAYAPSSFMRRIRMVGGVDAQFSLMFTQGKLGDDP